MSILTEAQTITHQSFFSGKLKEVVAGQPLDDTLMKALMIESSSQLRNWLILKEIMGQSELYALVINNYVAAVTPELPALPASLPLDEDDEKGLTYLRRMEIPLLVKPYARKIEKKLTSTSELFWRSLIVQLSNALYMGYLFSDVPAVPWRRQANVITHHTFRNSELEDVHAGDLPATAETIADLESKTTLRMKDWLVTIDVLRNTDVYNTLMTAYWAVHCQGWEE